MLDDDIVVGDLGRMVASQGRSGASDPTSAMELLDHWL